LVDIFLRNELLNFQRALALDGDGFELVGIEFEVLAFGDFVALDDVVVGNFVAGLGIDLAITDAIAGLFVELMKADFFSVRSSPGTMRSDTKRETASDSLSSTHARPQHSLLRNTAFRERAESGGLLRRNQRRNRIIKPPWLLDFSTFRSHSVLMPTRGDMLRFAIAFALMRARKLVRPAARTQRRGALPGCRRCRAPAATTR
jgi:hypothetical protein